MLLLLSAHAPAPPFALLQVVSGTGFEAAVAGVGVALSEGRTWLAGGSGPTAGDLAVWGALCAARQWDALRKGPKHAAVAAWADSVPAKLPAAAEALQLYMPAAAAASKAKKEAPKKAEEEDDGGSFEIGLKDAVEGGVVTRFPPEPSGFLHIGHAKAALLNEYFARQYKGKLILRFDDTNPAKENEDFVENIMADVAALGIVPDVVTYTSDHFEALINKAEELIRAGHCYVDDTPVDEMRAQRMDGIASKCRDNSVERNLAMWAEMVAGSEAGCKCCLRFKIDMSALNKTLRDPVAFRCNVTAPHHRTGSRFKCYPTYDCACPYVDAVEGVTHALRTSEYRDREAQYDWIQGAMNVRRVHIWDYSRLNFEFTTLSKRKLGWFVEAGKVPGWDDPRFPTVQGVRRRGLTVEALREFILSQGASRNLNLMTWEKLWTMNKRIIDPVCPRHTAVEQERVLLTLTGVTGPEQRTVLRHKKHPPAGEKTLWLAPQVWLDAADADALKVGEEATLMDWGNVIIRAKTAAADGQPATLSGELNLGGDVKKTTKLTWLAHLPAQADAALVPLELHEFDHLITKRKVEEEDKIEELFNEKSAWSRPAFGDCNMRALKKGEVLQLERKGYWIVDAPAADGKPVVLLSIPDGREAKPATPAAGAAPAAAGGAAALEAKREAKRLEKEKAKAAAAAAKGVAALAV